MLRAFWTFKEFLCVKGNLKRKFYFEGHLNGTLSENLLIPKKIFYENLY